MKAISLVLAVSAVLYFVSCNKHHSITPNVPHHSCLNDSTGSPNDSIPVWGNDTIPVWGNDTIPVFGTDTIPVVNDTIH